MGWQVADEVAARSAEIDDREFLAELFASAESAAGRSKIGCGASRR